MAQRKLIELLIDQEADAFGVEAISLVKYPAIESNFIYFSKQGKQGKTMYAMASVDEEKRTLIGPALIPDKHIPRYDEFSDEEYDVYFSKSTVQQASELFLKSHRTSQHTFEHEAPVEDVHVVESWIVSNPKMDKAHHFGLDLPEGTWVVRVQVDNDEMWQFVKEQKVAGFSIEGYFLDKLEQMSERPKPTLGRRLKSIVTGRKLYAEINLDNGATFATEDDEFTPGASIYKIGPDGTAVEVSNGTYKTKAGTPFEVYDGIVIEWDGKVKEIEESNSPNLVEQYKEMYEKKLQTMSARREFSSEDDVIVWYRVYNSNSYYADPEDVDLTFYPMEFRSFDEWQAHLREELKKVEERYPGFVVDEVEPVDWQMMPSAAWVLNEQPWNNLKAALRIEGNTDIPMLTILEAFADYSDADDDLEQWWDDKVVWTGSVLEYAYHIVEEDMIGEEQFKDYFSYTKFGRDLRMSGEFEDMVGEDEFMEAYGRMNDIELADAYFDYTGQDPYEFDEKLLKAYFDYEMFAQDMTYEGASEYGKGDQKFVVDGSR